MKFHRLSLSILATTVLAVAPALAHHVVWVDFSGFDLDQWSTINGGAPEDAVDAVQELVFANMVEDYAPFDLYFSRFKPGNGPYTRVRILGTSQGGLFGCAGPSCCASTNGCTGIDSWDDSTVSSCEVYAGSFASMSSFSGSNATTARIANTLSHTASHELGHVLSLKHCHAADDAMAVGCSQATTASADSNVNWHIMSSGSSWGLTGEQRATRDRFFSIHASRRLLYGELQARNHWDPLANVNGWYGGPSDLVYGAVDPAHQLDWYVRTSDGSTFGSSSTWQIDSGHAGDLFLLGDVNGDDREDLVTGEIVSSAKVRWIVRLSSGQGFSAPQVWRNDAGDVGDIFRLADVNGDGRDDLLYGRPFSSSQVTWYVRLSQGNGFGGYSTWSNDAGDPRGTFLVGDLDRDGRADLLYGLAESATQIKWWGRVSSGSSFGGATVWRNDFGNQGDLFYLGDLGGDGDADIIAGRMKTDTKVTWYARGSNGSSFSDGLLVLKNDAGNAGDHFRIGDSTGDGRVDLLFARNISMDDLDSEPNLSKVRWYGYDSNGSAFVNWAVWRNDAGNEGHLFP